MFYKTKNQLQTYYTKYYNIVIYIGRTYKITSKPILSFLNHYPFTQTHYLFRFNGHGILVKINLSVVQIKNGVMY
ncbi:hypothetical protein EB796_011564 [Bugula neritina]|uniref:Uncharacterized protein n=1 Tax=Bugula neritina TaxID=10212 RepID=A0A7J7JWM7_BUGNE|nr:hypothetical protein EB796_011564 [Bugula neritina]